MKRQLIISGEDAAATASGWVALRRSGEMSDADYAELERWLAADPAHRAALRQADEAWVLVGAASDHPDVLALREEAVLRARRTRPRFLTSGLSIAAGIAAALFLTGLAFMLPGGWNGARLWLGPIRQELHTSVGQRTDITLPDGSVVTLDTDTAIRTIESRRERRVELTKGQAFFRVAKDPGRPFVVVAGDRKVTAVGTEFGVRVDKGRFELTMVEGVVKVEAPLSAKPGAPPKIQTASMSAGSQLIAVVNRQWTIKPVDALKESGWTRGLLIYEATPLETVAEELNRYSERKIVIDDPAVARRLVNGTFRANDIDGAVMALESYGLVRVASEDQNVIRLAAAEKNSSREGM